jgi:hypothetical protein
MMPRPRIITDEEQTPGSRVVYRDGNAIANRRRRPVQAQAQQHRRLRRPAAAAGKAGAARGRKAIGFCRHPTTQRRSERMTEAQFIAEIDKIVAAMAESNTEDRMLPKEFP